MPTGSGGIASYSTTPIENETTDATVTWKEGQLPSTVNNGVRELFTNLREQFNDLPWFDYGIGTQDTDTHLGVPSLYASATSYTITGADVTAAYHAGRPTRAIGTGTGTIYGFITSSSYSGGTDTTTVNVFWLNGGALQNEDLAVTIGLPVIGFDTRFVITHEHDGGGDVPSTGTKGAGVTIPWNFEIIGWYLMGNSTGSLVLDIKSKAFASNDPPTVSITASAKPTLSSSAQETSTTLTGWTKQFTGPMALKFSIVSITTITAYTLILYCRKI